MLLFLAAAIVLVQALGLMHGVLHDRAAAAGVKPVPSSEGSWVQALFDGHDNQADCDDFDHMTQAGHTGFDQPSFEALPLRGTEVVCHEGWHLAQQAAGFLARGPPLALI